jgi:hypothetical protein
MYICEIYIYLYMYVYAHLIGNKAAMTESSSGGVGSSRGANPDEIDIDDEGILTSI